VPPKAAGSPCHVISVVCTENTSESSRETQQTSKLFLATGRGGARLPGPVGCFSTSVAYGHLYIIIGVFRHRELHCVVSASHLPGTAQLSLRTYQISCLHAMHSFRCEVIEKYISSRPCQMYDHQVATSTVGLLHTYALASAKPSMKSSNTRLMHLVATRISCCLLM